MTDQKIENQFTRNLLIIFALVAIIVLSFFYILLSEPRDPKVIALAVTPSIIASLLAFVVIYSLYFSKRIEINPWLLDKFKDIQHNLHELNQSDLKFITFWNDVEKLKKIIINDTNFKPDIVVGVGRGGAIVGGILAGNMIGLQHLGIDRNVRKKKNDDYELIIIPSNLASFSEMLAHKRVLVVMLAIRSGKTLSFAKDSLWESVPKIEDIKTSAVYALKEKAKTPHKPDYIPEYSTSNPNPFKTDIWPDPTAS
ncbi:MAG: hypothetical protein KJ687_00330 [Proteobacteria bacterium]|nr:hypothetical protein [Pseudomonadota bacterium]